MLSAVVAFAAVGFEATYAAEMLPPITEKMIVNAIYDDLAYNAPHLTIDLDAAKPGVTVDNLVRAGVLRILGTTKAGPQHEAGMQILLVTEEGQRIAQQRGWSIAGGELNIPVGQLAYVPGSYKILNNGRIIHVTFAWRFVANENLAHLLRISPGNTWPQSMYPTCYDATGTVNATITDRVIDIVPDGFGGWSNLEGAVYPIRGCENHHGASRIVGAAQRPVSEPNLQDMILQNLAYHAPEYYVLLDQASPDAGVRDLEKAGILERLYTSEDSCHGPKAAFVLTERGQALAAILGWSVYRDMLVVPTGRFVYIPNTVSIRGDASRPEALTFRFRYEPSKNAAVLLGFGHASDWDTGDGLSLASSGKTLQKTVFVQYDGSRGWLEQEWLRTQSFVC